MDKESKVRYFFLLFLLTLSMASLIVSTHGCGRPRPKLEKHEGQDTSLALR